MAFGKSVFSTTGGLALSKELRESLLSILKDVSPNEDNYFISNLGVGSPAMNVLHEWNLYYASRPSSVTTKVEGAQTSYSDLTQETRQDNRTAICEEPIRLSRTRASIAMVSGEDAMGLEKERALKRLKAQMEWITINGAYASGKSGEARQMRGIDGMISTNATVRASGYSFSETELNDICQASYDSVGSQYLCDIVALPMKLKRRIASFGTNITRNIDAADKRLTDEVRVFDSDVGNTLMVIAHKDVRDTAGTTTVLALREELFEHSFLVNSGEPHWEDRAKDGDRENGVYITEFTVVGYQEKASVKRTGYSHTL